jgi:hypothetical protein
LLEDPGARFSTLGPCTWNVENLMVENVIMVENLIKEREGGNGSDPSH